MTRFIVGEVSKNWVKRDAKSAVVLICQMFEEMIEVNRRRGYRLHSFDVNRVMTDPNNLNETIIAVFERDAQTAEGK